MLTGVVRVLHQLRHPRVTDEDAFLLGVILFGFEALLGSFGDDLSHVFLLESTENAEEELPLWKLAGELLLGREILGKEGVPHRVVVEVLDRELLVGGDLELDHLVLLEVLLGLGEDVSHEA